VAAKIKTFLSLLQTFLKIIFSFSIITRSHNLSHNPLMRFSQTSLLKRSIIPFFLPKNPYLYTMNSCLIIIPTYNEKENINKIIPAILSQPIPAEILIVDDNSPDGTANIVRELQKDNKKIHLITRKAKLGLGTAYLTGFKCALDNNFDYIFEMDDLRENHYRNEH